MNRPIKLLILIILSLSVYFIYYHTNKPIKVLVLGDNPNTFSSNSVIINNKYASNNLSIKYLFERIKLERTIKRDLIESHKLILSIGYNDLLYDLSIEDNINNHHFSKITKSIEKDYNNLIKEIRKYYKNEIIVTGYPKSQKEDYYINIGIKKLNKILKNNKEVIYIDTYYCQNKDIENKIIHEILAK